MADQLLEQSPDWGWSSHGETGDALLKQNALNERDRLAADDAVCFDLLNTRTLQRATVHQYMTSAGAAGKQHHKGRGGWGTWRRSTAC